MKVLAILTVFAVKYCLFFYVLIQEVKTQCTSVCEYEPDPIGFATCSSRSLTSIPEDCSAATYLQMSRNELKYLDDTSLAGYSNLLYIYLENNSIRNITPRAFAACTQLREIFLQNNPLVVIQDNTFFGLSGLSILYVNSASLQSVQANAFTGLQSLERLFLNNNTLTTLPITVFQNLRTLQILMLSNNRLQSLHREQFKTLIQLRHLDIKHNQITRLGQGLFRGLLSLVELNLSTNIISEIHARAFDFTVTVNLEEIDFTNNNIVSTKNMSTQMVDIKNVFFAGNPIICNCDNLLLMEWYQRHTSSLNENKGTNVVCNGPRKLTGTPMKNVSDDVIERCTRASIPTESNLEVWSIRTTTKTSMNYRIWIDSNDEIIAGINPVATEDVPTAENRNSDTEDDNKLFMFIGIGAVAVCFIVIIIGAVIMCRWFGGNKTHSQVPQEPPPNPAPQITENPLLDPMDESGTNEDDDEVYESISVLPDFTRRRSRLISERSVDSAYSEGSSPDGIDYPPPTYPPPPPPHQTFSGYIPVFQSKNGQVYLCTRCPHDSVVGSGQPVLMHSVSVPAHCSDLANMSNSQSQRPPMLRQNSVPERHEPTQQTHYIRTRTYSEQTPSQQQSQTSSGIGLQDEHIPQDSPPIPLQTNIAHYAKIDLSSYPSTNPFANPAV